MYPTYMPEFREILDMPDMWDFGLSQLTQVSEFVGYNWIRQAQLASLLPCLSAKATCVHYVHVGAYCTW